MAKNTVEISQGIRAAHPHLGRHMFQDRILEWCRVFGDSAIGISNNRNKLLENICSNDRAAQSASLDMLGMLHWSDDTHAILIDTAVNSTDGDLRCVALEAIGEHFDDSGDLEAIRFFEEISARESDREISAIARCQIIGVMQISAEEKIRRIQQVTASIKST